MSSSQSPQSASDFSRSKLYRTWSLLTVKEWNELRDWLRSPAVTTLTAPLRAYDAVKDKYPAFDVEKASIYRAVYGKRPYDNLSFNNLLSKLNRLTEDFLLYRQVCKNKVRRAEALRVCYRERGALDQHAEAVKAALKCPADAPSDEWTVLERLRRRHDAYFYAPEDVVYADESPHLDGVIEALEVFTRLLRTKVEFEQANRRAILDNDDGAEPESIAPVPPVLPAVELYALFADHPAPDLETCETLDARYRASYTSLSPAYRRIFGITLMNRLIRLNGAVGTPAVALFARHVRFLDEHGLLTRNGYLMGPTYLNVVAAAIMSEDYVYAEDLARRYELQLPADRRSSVAATARARIAFARGDFEEAAALANRPAANYPQYEILRRMVGVKAGLELGLLGDPYTQDWTFEIDNLERYLRRNTYYSKSRRAPFLHFSLLTRRLGNALLPEMQPERLARVRKAVQEKPCYGEKWLLEVIGRYSE